MKHLISALMLAAGITGTAYGQAQGVQPAPIDLIRTAPLVPGPVAGCQFDVIALQFIGDAQTQALCLLRPNGRGGELGARLPALPDGLELVGQPYVVAPQKVSAALATSGLPPEVLATVFTGISRADSNNPGAPLARYFVLHDTSTPYLADAPAFPDPLDTNAMVNRLDIYDKTDPVAHMFIARDGAIFVGHDYSEPWRATKLERIVGPRARGLFLHNELVQPRRADPAGAAGNDLIAPEPGFSGAQYRLVAALYVLASARAGQWLIPAYHSAIDDLIPAKHDDPQNFDLNAFAAEVAKWRAIVEN